MQDFSISHSRTSESETSFEKSAIEELLGTFFIPHNRIRLLESGQETFQTILDSVSTAQEIICIEFYIFKDDDTGKRLAELLKEKSRQGVRVYILYDHFGSFLTSRAFWSDLKKAGVKLRASHPFKWSAPRSYIYRDHKKLLIVDGKKAFTGGFNIADEYYGYLKKRKKWRDIGIYLEGPIASTMLDMFVKSWTTWKGEPIIWNRKIQPITNGIPVIPIFASSAKARRRMRKLFIHSINNARESIFLTTAYFTPSKRILKALEHAAKRGVNLKLLLPGKTDIMPVYYAGRAYYKRLLKAGVEIYNYQGAALHAKTAVFDGCWSIIGSTNLDFQSLRRNDESNVGILDRDFGKQMIEVFQKDLQNSTKIETETWAKRPFYQKVLEKLFSVIMKRFYS
jgi:cardiolipin synthase